MAIAHTNGTVDFKGVSMIRILDCGKGVKKGLSSILPPGRVGCTYVETKCP
jgi:hypothetical protein